MEPIKTDNTNAVYIGISEAPEVMDLPCEREVDSQGSQVVVHSVWCLSPEEREAIARGENIKLGIYTHTPIPPVSLQVVDEQEVQW